MSFSLKPYLTGDAADRKDSLTDMDPAFMRQVDKLYDAAPDDIREKLKITSAYRSWTLQNQMYQDAIRKYGSANVPGHQVAHPAQARHVSGRAIDIANKAAPEAEEWLYDNAPKLGFHRPVPGERWHFELTPQALEEAQREYAWQTGQLTGTPKFMSKVLSDARQPPTAVQSYDVFSPSEQTRAIHTAQPIATPDMQFKRGIEPTSLPSAQFEKPQSLFVVPERVKPDPYIPLGDPEEDSEYTRLPQSRTQRETRLSPIKEVSPDILDQLSRAFSVLTWRK